MTIEGGWDDKKEINCVEYMLDEILNYAGEGSVTHDDFLDCIERIHEEECGIVFPTSSLLEQGRTLDTRQYQQPKSWESVY